MSPRPRTPQDPLESLLSPGPSTPTGAPPGPPPYTAMDPHGHGQSPPNLLEGAAPPGAQAQPTARAPIRTARLFITNDIPRCHLSPPGQCRGLANPGPAVVPPLQAAAPLGVAGVALGAAVHVVGAADGLGDKERRLSTPGHRRGDKCVPFCPFLTSPFPAPLLQ